MMSTSALFRGGALAGLLACAGCELFVIHTFVPCDDPPETFWQSVAVADGHACAVDVEGGLQCWGDALELSGTDVAAVDLGDALGCLLDGTGRLQCVGAEPPEGDGFVELSVGRDHACAVAAPGELHCWGADEAGQVSAAPASSVDRVAAGDGFSCATDATTLLPVCWGDAVADGAPADVPLAALGAGGPGVCGVDPAGQAVCWGEAAGMDTEGGGLGEPLVELAVGEDIVCGIDSMLTLRCVGDGAAAVPELSAISVSVAPGPGGGGCAVSDVGRLRCWGAAAKGRP